MDLQNVIEQVGKDKGIERETLIETLEAAVLTAARRAYGSEREIEAQYNEETGELELYQIITVTDEEDVENPYREVTVDEIHEAGFDAEPGDELLFQIFYKDKDRQKAKLQDKRFGDLLKLDSYNATFGRIAAQTAKQVIIQRVREAERDMVYDEYKDRTGEVITGIVRRFEKGDIIVDLGRADAILPSGEQTQNESYRPGDRVQALIKEVKRSSRGPQILLTRADPQLLIKLFEQEVPEIYEDIVQIVAVAREAGVRSKVAVYSQDSDVDPVGACVGMQGTRVQNVVGELGGEKIDIVPYSEDPARFVTNAISPAEVRKVLLDEADKTMELVVPDDQLSLAIGRGGQNVRLAAQLTGWDLDIVSLSDLEDIKERTSDLLVEFQEIDADMVETLFSVGFNRIEHLRRASQDELAKLPGFDAKKANQIMAAAEIIYERSEGSKTPLTVAEQYRQRLETVRGVGDKLAEDLFEAGYVSVEHLAFVDDAQTLAEAADIPAKKAEQIKEAAQTTLQKNQELETEEQFQAYREEFFEGLDEQGLPVDLNPSVESIVSQLEALSEPESSGDSGAEADEQLESEESTDKTTEDATEADSELDADSSEVTSEDDDHSTAKEARVSH